MIPGSILGLLLAVSLALIHIFAGRSLGFSRLPDRFWTSFAGGISIAYIFLDIFPELSLAQAEIEHGAIATYLENHVYLLSLAGLALFYGLEKLALTLPAKAAIATGPSLANEPADSTAPTTAHSPANLQVSAPEALKEPNGIFWIHIFSFAIYNAILGYLFRESANHGIFACLILFAALGLHFVVNDLSLRKHHPHVYDHKGRWILAGAILSGYGIGQSTHFEAAAVAAIWALVAGGVIMNVMKEELPEKNNSHFGLFVCGAALYATIILAM